MITTRVVWQIHLYSVSIHTLSQDTVNIATPDVVLPAGSGGMIAGSSTYTTSLMYHQMNLKQGRSGRRGDQVLTPASANSYLCKFAISKVNHLLVEMSCSVLLESRGSGSSSFITGMKNSLNRSIHVHRHTMPVAVYSAKKPTRNYL